LKFFNSRNLQTSFFFISTYESQTVKKYIRLCWDQTFEKRTRHGAVKRSTTVSKRCSPKNLHEIVSIIVAACTAATLVQMQMIEESDAKCIKMMRATLTIVKYKEVMNKLGVVSDPKDYDFCTAEYKVSNEGDASFAAKLNLTGEQWIRVAALLNL
jgi:hypothetical protein